MYGCRYGEVGRYGEVEGRGDGLSELREKEND